MTREQLKEIANDTVSISKSKKYSIKGKIIEIRENFYTKLYQKIQCDEKPGKKEGKITFVNESVVSTILKLKDKEKVTVLNFASAKNPGGGFLNGSNAQEESLARVSNLYLSLKKYQKEFYNYNKEQSNPLYTDDMIFSRNISVFKKDNGSLLNMPILVNIITSPAVNAGVARERGIKNEKIDFAMQQRIRKIIHIAAKEHTDYLVLGAFGCGVFQNSDMKVAQMFKQVLEVEGMKTCFKEVIFSIYDEPHKFNRFIRYYNAWL